MTKNHHYSCPFCGGIEIMPYDKPSQSTEKTLWRLYCLTCQAEGPIKYSFEDAVNSWNTRWSVGDYWWEHELP